jgi:hypothetical protein
MQPFSYLVALLAVYPHAPDVACLPIAIRCSWYHKGIGVVPGGTVAKWVEYLCI